MLCIDNLSFLPTYSHDDLISAAAKKLKLSPNDILDIKILKKSIDARRKTNVIYCISLGVSVKNEKTLLKKFAFLREYNEPELCFSKKTVSASSRPIICGFGPAGMFAALYLARAGARPIVIERGASIDERIKANNAFITSGKLNTQTNIQFGEGGAGTFSDGKLTTGVKDKRIYTVLKTFFEFGAPEEILYLSKPHLGTDNLCRIVKNLRNEIISLGGEILFNTQLVNVLCQNSMLSGVTVKAVNGNRILPCKHLILACGHSAEDVFMFMKKNGALMEQKPFSIGVRIEHKQADISFAQYGEAYKHLPPRHQR